jgi:isopenicillin N synthase-like dioxygenase
MDVKVVNFRSNSVDSDMLESVLNTGFVVLTHHGIDEGLIRDGQQAWRDFFLSDQEWKNSYVNAQDGNFGYKGMKSEKAVGAKKPDLKEFFHWQPGQDCPRDAIRATERLYAQLEDIALQVLGILEQRSERKDYRESCLGSDNTILRSLYYPALDFSQEPDAVRAAAHEDINHITLLVAATAAGLEVKDAQGNWHSVPHEENSIVVNIGDMLQLASGGLYRSTTHRVVNPDNSRSDRISMPLFVHPRSSTILSPGFTAQEYLAQRIAEIHGHVMGAKK